MHYQFLPPLLLLVLMAGQATGEVAGTKRHDAPRAMRTEDLSIELREKWSKAPAPTEKQLAELLTLSGGNEKYSNYSLVCVKCQMKDGKENSFDRPFERYVTLVATAGKQVFPFFTEEDSISVKEDEKPDTDWKDIPITEPMAAKALLGTLEQASAKGFTLNNKGEMEHRIPVAVHEIFSDLDVHTAVQIKLLEGRPIFRIQKDNIPNEKKTHLSAASTFIEYCTTKTVLTPASSSSTKSMPK